ncbi:unnamed protein product [Polarella glacialis]|uniref:Uncharacterized protein n=1 Tax=Polarella glacialis TaxID=89957 RepID=A0A813K7X3_POLGL|nr:unnamed protein product [Polarella glacialis]
MANGGGGGCGMNPYYPQSNFSCPADEHCSSLMPFPEGMNPCSKGNIAYCDRPDSLGAKHMLAVQELPKVQTFSSDAVITYVLVDGGFNACGGQTNDWTLAMLNDMYPAPWYVDPTYFAGVCYVGNNGGAKACAKLCAAIDGCNFFSTSTTEDCYACFVYPSCSSPIQVNPYEYSVYQLKTDGRAKQIGYRQLSGDCPGNNIQTFTDTSMTCVEQCNSDHLCHGFSESGSSCITKSEQCSDPSDNGWIFYAKIPAAYEVVYESCSLPDSDDSQPFYPFSIDGCGHLCDSYKGTTYLCLGFGYGNYPAVGSCTLAFAGLHTGQQQVIQEENEEAWHSCAGYGSLAGGYQVFRKRNITELDETKTWAADNEAVEISTGSHRQVVGQKSPHRFCMTTNVTAYPQCADCPEAGTECYGNVAVHLGPYVSTEGSMSAAAPLLCFSPPGPCFCSAPFSSPGFFCNSGQTGSCPSGTSCISTSGFSVTSPSCGQTRTDEARAGLSEDDAQARGQEAVSAARAKARKKMDPIMKKLSRNVLKGLKPRLAGRWDELKLKVRSLEDFLALRKRTWELKVHSKANRTRSGGVEGNRTRARSFLQQLNSTKPSDWNWWQYFGAGVGGGPFKGKEISSEKVKASTDGWLDPSLEANNLSTPSVQLNFYPHNSFCLSTLPQ